MKAMFRLILAWGLLIELAFAAMLFAPHVSRTALAAPGRVAYGEWNPAWQSGNGVVNSVIAARESDMSHPLDLIHWYASDTEGYSSYDHVLVDNALSLGRTPFVSWGLPVGFSNIAHLDDWANGIKLKAPSLVYIRLFWEFNDPPQGSNGTWGVCQSSRAPAQLVQTWQLIVNTFRADGASNVRWVWNPDGTMGSQMWGNSCGSLGAAYPGDSYVDFRGFDTYGYNNLAQYDAENAQTGSSRPLLLGETNVRDSQSPSTWVGDLSSRLQAGGGMPLVAGVVWFNEGAYAFSQNPNSRAAVRSMLQTPSFQPPATPSPTPSASSSASPATRLSCPVVVNPSAGQTVVCTYQ